MTRVNGECICHCLLQQRTYLHDEDEVGVLQRRQAVRNAERRAAAARCHGVERSLHNTLRVRIKCRCSLVEEEDSRVADDGARDADTLALPPRELAGDDARARHRAISMRQLAHKRVRVCKARRRNDLLL